MAKEKNLSDFEIVHDDVDIVIGPGVQDDTVQLESGRIQWRINTSAEDFAVIQKAAAESGVTTEEFIKDTMSKKIEALEAEKEEK